MGNGGVYRQMSCQNVDKWSCISGLFYVESPVWDPWINQYVTIQTDLSQIKYKKKLGQLLNEYRMCTSCKF